MFPRAHAVAYVIMSLRIAYYKVYYPQEFYSVYFTAKAENFDERVILQGQKAIERRMDEILRKGNEASKKEEADLPILEVEQVAFFSDGHPFEYSISHHRSDKSEFSAISIR